MVHLAKDKKGKVVPTELQAAAFRKYLECIKEGKAPKLSQIMIDVGYSPRSAENPAILYKSPAWAVLKETLDGEGARNAFNDLVSPENEDKRVRLASAIEITKIQGGYPVQENKIIGIFGNLGELQKKDDRPEDTTGEDSIPTSSGTEESTGV